MGQKWEPPMGEREAEKHTVIQYHREERRERNRK